VLPRRGSRTSAWLDSCQIIREINNWLTRRLLFNTRIGMAALLVIERYRAQFDFAVALNRTLFDKMDSQGLGYARDYMKFTDGNWMMQPGMKAAYPAEAFETNVTAQMLEFYLPTRQIRHRGDTLEGPVLTLQISSPLSDVIRVRVSHFEGGHIAKPQFNLFEQVTKPDIKLDAQVATLTSGNLTARVNTAHWNLEFLAADKIVTRSPERGTAYVKTDSLERFMFQRLSLEVGELVYGLGERFTAFVKNGQSVEIWNKDGGTGSDQSYKNLPFYLTNRGYGVFVNHPEQVDFEVATEKVSSVQFSVPGEVLEYFVIYGPTPKEVLEKYTALTGRPALPPAWSFGLWLSTSFTTNYDEATMTSFLDGMKDRDLPLSVFHFDCFWMRAFRWCDFEWDPSVFPDPKGMLERFRQRGLKICVWINPYIAQRSPLFDEGMANGFLLKRLDGSVWQWDMWQPGMAIVDFTNPAASAWYTGCLERLLDMGVDCFKTDFGERIPIDDVAWFDGSDPQKMHNYYPYLFNKAVFEKLRETKNEAVLFARSATVGCQQFPVHWGGDCDSSFVSMAESLRGGLSLGLSGFGFWSHDIGGFEGNPPVAVYKRWLAFGLLSSHSRLHGSTSYRVPWIFDDESVDVLRFFSKLKCRLMPYLFQKAIEARASGVPMMRAMLLEFPNDPTAQMLDQQYMLGDALLVAPVFSGDNTVTYFLPKGDWTNFFSERRVQGGHWITEEHGFQSLPLLVRPNTLLAFGAVDSRPDYDFGSDPTLTLYALENGASATAMIPTMKGEIDFSVTVKRDGQNLTITRTGTARPFSLRVAGLSLQVHIIQDTSTLELPNT
jgi:alpha-D-xyloside xylohydrolase